MSLPALNHLKLVLDLSKEKRKVSFVYCIKTISKIPIFETLNLKFQSSESSVQCRAQIILSDT